MMSVISFLVIDVLSFSILSTFKIFLFDTPFILSSNAFKQQAKHGGDSSRRIKALN